MTDQNGIPISPYEGLGATFGQQRVIDRQQMAMQGLQNLGELASGLFGGTQAPDGFDTSSDFHGNFGLDYNFHRVNERAKVTKLDRENGIYQEPLDELRMEVAEWLN